MAYLFYGFDIDWHAKIIDNALAALQKSPSVILSMIEHNLPSSKCDVKQFPDEYNKLVSNDFSFMKLEDYIPLDSNVIEKMSRTEIYCLSALDRYEFSKGGNDYHKRRKQYLDVLRYVNDLFVREHIGLVVVTNIPHLLCGMVIYGYCKAFGIPIVMWYAGTIIPGKTTTGYFLTDMFDPLPGLGTADLKCVDGASSKLADIYIEKYGPQDGPIESLVVMDSYFKRPSRLLILKTKLSYWMKRFRSSDFSFFERHRFHSRLRKNKRFLSRNSKSPDLGRKYLYFALHFQPECTSMPMGGVYADQLLVCEMISSFLPHDVYLYVKPHPNPSRVATVDFYKRIGSLRNTVLVSDACNTYDLIDNSIAVVTLTGTVALEALVREKPVMMFGFYYYQYAPGVFHIKTDDDCRKALDAITNGHFHCSITDFRRFIAQYEKLSINGYLDNSFAEISPISVEESIKNVSEGLISFIKDNGIVENKR